MSTVVGSNAAQPAPDALRALHARLGRAVREADGDDDFFTRYAAELVEVLRAAACAVYIADETGKPKLVGRRGLEVRQAAVYEPLVAGVLVDGFGTIVPPDGPERKAGPEKNEGADKKAAREAPRRNPTDRTAMLYPIRLGTTTRGVTLVLLGPDVPRGSLPELGRVLVPLCDFAAEFLYRSQTTTAADGRTTRRDSAHATTRLKQPATNEERGTLPTDFALQIHASLDLHRTAQTIAGEVRRTVDCDRVGIGLFRRRQAQALAFSGQDRFDPRSNLVRLWERLAGTIAAAGETLDYPTRGERPLPQIDAAASALVDESHARQMLVVPLSTDRDAEPVGVLTIEQIGPGRELSASAKRLVAEIVPHAASALANAVRYESLPFRFLASLPLAARAATSARNLPKSATAVVAAVLLVAALVLVPWEFTVEAPGTLQPVVRREVFAAVDGTVDQVFVHSGDHVAQGDPLVELRNTEVDFGEADLLKQMNETEQELLNAERFYKQGRNLSAEEQARLPGQIALLEQRRENLRRQAVLMNEKRRQLRVTSPLAGQVATWNVSEQLAQRPVRRGQALLSLVDPAGEWEVEVRLPEDRLGSVVEARRALKQGDALQITFQAATDPGSEYVGTVREIGLAAEPHEQEGNVVRVRAAIDKRQLAQLHPGADVRVRVHCGSRSLGYVLLHDVWAFVQSQILFRL